MMQTDSQNNYHLLIEKLDQFIRKFYMNKFIRGSLYAIGLIVLLFLAITLLEHYFYFSSGVRKGLFFSFIGISGLALVGWVFKPLLNYFNLGKLISHEQAATIIGDHFTNVKDKLLNILQLKSQAESAENTSLVNASIDQKISALKPVPFKSAINLNQNKKYLKYALPPLMLLLTILFAAPKLISNSTSRLIQNNKEFERPAPFLFDVENEDMTVVQFEDFQLDVKVNPNGESGALPNEVFINIDNYEYKLVKNSPSTFSYKFSKIAKDTKFFLHSSGFESKSYGIDVLKKPNLVGFDVKMNYPSYTGRKNEMVNNIGDMVVPYGTNITWNFNSQNTDDIDIKFSNQKEAKKTERVGESLFQVKRRAMKDQTYMVYVSNKLLPNADSVFYSISVVPDLYPNISVETFEDSTDNKLLFFVGDASDDYGIKSLTFNYKIGAENESAAKLNSVPMSFSPGTSASYDHTWDIRELGLKPGDKITYFFEVFDNDAVNGSKSARTSLMSYAMPSVEEFQKLEEENNEEIKEDLQKSIQESKDLRKDLKELKENLVQKKELDWQDKKEIENLLERQKELEENLKNAQENFEQNMENQSEFEETKEEILEKQEKIQELFEELMSDEMKELMKKLEELLDDMSRDDALMELDEMEMSDEELEKELDRMLELFKEMEMEHQLEQTAEKLEELAEKQEELSKESEKENSNTDQIEKEQEKLNEEFDKVQEEMDKLEEMNEELETPKELDNMEEEQESIDQDMEKSSDDLKKDQKKSASKSQKSASEKMKDMASKMRGQMAQAQQDQMKEDIESLRQLLENLVDMSFDQEELMDEFTKTSTTTPRFVELVQDQYKLKDDFKLIEDSLQALSKRVFQIESFVTEKVTDVKRNLKGGLEDLEERKKGVATVKQQYVMTGVNDLALMLSEVMEQMQQQMANSMPGDQMCQNPGQGKGQGKGKKMSMSDMQKQLNDQITKMQEDQKNGKGGKSGKAGEKGKGESQRFAEMAAKQAAIRKAMREMAKEAQEQGQGSKQMEDLMKEMDKTETELVNKKLTNQMMKRQQEIMTKLLEAEKAQRERQYDNKRKSETAREQERKMPPSLEEYIKKREAEIEMYKTVSPSLKPFYKSLVEDYFNSLKKQ